MKLFLVGIFSALIGCALTFFVTARLSAEIEGQAKLQGLSSEIMTITIYSKEQDRQKAYCLLKNEIELRINKAKEIEEWFNSRQFKLSSLNEQAINNINEAIVFYNNMAEKYLSKQCNET